jgi:O-antigen/teichoic acid export membrane protein
MSIGRDTTYNLAAAVAPALCMLVVVPFYIQLIGAARFGVLAICWTLVAAVRFASLGMGPALTYRLAKIDARSSDSRSSLFWTALFLALATSMIGAGLVVGIGEIYFRYFFTAASGLNWEIRHALPVLAALLPVSILIGVMNGALQGIRRFGALSAISIVNAILFSGLPLAVAWLISIKLPGLIAATIAANGAVVIVELAICAKLLPLQLPRWPNRSDVTSLLSYGAWMSGTALISPLLLLLDRFVIGALRGPTAVAAYVLPYNLVQQLIQLPASLSNAVLPRLATLPDDEVRELQGSSLRSLDGLLTPLAIVSIALAAPFFHIWIGPTLAALASPVAALLVVGGWMHGMAHIPSIILQGRNRPDVVTKLLLACLVPYVVALYLATLHFGVIGAATVWTIRTLFDLLLFQFTRPATSDIRQVAVSAVFVLIAMTAALLLPWTKLLYWMVMIGTLTAACFHNRNTLIPSAASLRVPAQQLSNGINDLFPVEPGL